MSLLEKNNIRIAILDLYEGQANQGMRCIREILTQFGDNNHLNISWDEFDVRQKQEVPDLSYDIFISSGGPGSPLDSKGSDWENAYFNWFDSVQAWNENDNNHQKKYVFLICHSFQLACRYLQFGTVCLRKSTSFGVFPIHLLKDGKDELVFEGMDDPFYVVDSRDYQVIDSLETSSKSGLPTVLAIEKERPHVQLQRAIMAVRFNDFMIGTQFHPEADASGMSVYLKIPEKKKNVIENHGEAKWLSMIEQLNDPDKIMFTYEHILPNFLSNAVENLQLIEI